MPLPFSRRALQTAPSFSRDFAGLKTLDHGVGPAITFTRASNATFFDANGTLQTASNDAPRFDHDPATGASRGLLIEEARTNLYARSAELDNAYWQKNNLTVTANTHTAPDGTLTADSVIENVDVGVTHRVDRAMSATSGTAYTLSAFVKLASGTRRPQLFAGVPFGSWTATFDLTNGTVATTSGSPSSTSITSVGNGWYRISGTKTATSTASADTRIQFVNESTGSGTYDGDGTSGFHVWGMQLEEGAFATSYIPTTTAAATRAADSAVVTPISSFYNQAEGTLFVEFQATTLSLLSSRARRIVSFDDNAGSVFVALTQNGANNGARFVSSISGSTQFDFTPSASITNVCKGIVAFRQDDAIAAVNGTLTANDTTGTLPAVTHLLIGKSEATQQLQGHIRKLAYWPRRLSNSLLQQLTT